MNKLELKQLLFYGFTSIREYMTKKKSRLAKVLNMAKTQIQVLSLLYRLSAHVHTIYLIQLINKSRGGGVSFLGYMQRKNRVWLKS
jgi:hypothetical protein